MPIRTNLFVGILGLASLGAMSGIAQASPTFTMDADEVTVWSGATPVNVDLPIRLTGTNTGGGVYNVSSFGLSANFPPSFSTVVATLSSATAPGFTATPSPSISGTVINKVSLSGSATTPVVFSYNTTSLLATITLTIPANTPVGVYPVTLGPTNELATGDPPYIRPGLSVVGLNFDDVFEINGVFTGQITILPEPATTAGLILLACSALSRRTGRLLGSIQ